MADAVWSQEVELRSKDVNLHRRLRTSRLFELLQEASIAHTEELGWPRETTLDRGFLWMVALQRVEVVRMPEYGETVVLRTWPGPMMHVLFPRQYLLEAADGTPLVRASSIWTLVDMATRAMADPDAHGVVIEGVKTGGEIELPRPIRFEECDHAASFTVPFSYCDLNGHMNNTRYLDVVEDHLAGPANGRELAAISAEYMSEIRMGDQVDLKWHEDEDGAFFEGSKDDRRCFCVSLEYR